MAEAILESNPDDFSVKRETIADTPCILIHPCNISAKWNTRNLCLRSCVLEEETLKPVSLSYSKFFNWGEHPEITTPPVSTDDCEIIEKLDGSLLIVSLYKGALITRTRGTVDARKLDNGDEIEKLMEMYPNAFVFRDEFGTRITDTASYSLLFEWVSRRNRIVIDYGVDYDMYLVGAINHDDYSLSTQLHLDYVAKYLGVKRPQRFKFNSVVEMTQAVEVFKNVEGVVVYFNNGQSLLKLKAAEYLARHRFKENATIENTIDLYISFGRPNYSEFKDKLVAVFDYECFDMIAGFASSVCDAAKEVEKIIEAMQAKVNSFKGVSRKDAALTIIQNYGGEKNSRASMAFALLDGKSLTNDQYKRLIYQSLK